MKICMQSPAERFVSQSAANSAGTSDISPATPLEFMIYSITTGRAVKISGMMMTVSSTMRFLNTSAHSFSMIVQMWFMAAS